MELVLVINNVKVLYHVQLPSQPTFIAIELLYTEKKVLFTINIYGTNLLLKAKPCALLLIFLNQIRYLSFK